MVPNFQIHKSRNLTPQRAAHWKKGKERGLICTFDELSRDGYSAAWIFDADCHDKTPFITLD